MVRVKVLRPAVTALVLCAVTSPAFAALVGPASAYNAFVFGNFTSSNTDTAGDLAAGGNVSLTNYSVASAIAGNSGSNPNPARLVVGGNLTATNGGIGSNGSSPAQNGAIYAVGTVSRTSFTANGGQFSTSLINFASAQTLYQSTATGWASLTANGTAVLANNGSNTLTLTGSNSVLNVINVTSAQFNASQSININAPAGSTVLINVSGTSATFQNGQVTLTGVNSSQVVYNLYQATSLNLAGSKDPKGTVLAPYAAVTGGYGHMDGQLVAGSYNGNTQFGNVLFTGNVVPLPAAAWLLLSGLAGVGSLRRRRRLAA
jgi:choice-of-anchor A domain-containing protein